MDVNTKYKRWGWGAVIGLVAVILIAGLVVAVTMSSPKKAKEVASDDGSDVSLIADGGNSGDDKKTDGSADGGDTKTDDGKTDTKTDGKTDDKKSGSGSDGAAADGTDGANNAGKKDTSGSTGNTGTSGTSGTSGNSGKSGSSSMPKTGPKEDLISIVALATIAGLAAYNLGFFKKSA